MISTTYKILAHLEDEERASDFFYLNFEELGENTIRTQLKKLVERGWIELTKREKTSDGPGRPMHVYGLTKQGHEELLAFKQEIADLEKELRS